MRPQDVPSKWVKVGPWHYTIELPVVEIDFGGYDVYEPYDPSQHDIVGCQTDIPSARAIELRQGLRERTRRRGDAS